MQRNTPAHTKPNTLPAPLAALATQTSLYRVRAEGNNLAPRLFCGDVAIIAPAVSTAPEEITPGSIVLVAIEQEDLPGSYQQIGLYRMNADGDIVAGSSTVEKGKYIVLGIAQENRQ